GLVQACREHERPVLVDTSGPALLDAARAGADVLKPNLGEALAATGEDTPLAAARALLGLGAGTVVCSLGADGMLGVHRAPAGDAAWQAAPAEAISGNPTGAGDSVVAVLAARLLVDADPLPDVLRHAVAVSASAVTCPVAGQIDPGLAAQLLPTVSIEEIPCP
ncbi:PfkB family carbohydrate kinase, partial [Brachybacterium alimentarium]